MKKHFRYYVLFLCLIAATMIFTPRISAELITRVEKVFFLIFNANGPSKEGGESLGVIPHAGVSEAKSFPNTSKAIEQSCKKGYRGIEVDVIYNDNLAPILKKRLSMINSSVSPTVKSYVTPTLKEFCRDYSGCFDLIYLDIKSDDKNGKEKIKKLINDLREGGCPLDKVYFIGQSMGLLSQIKKRIRARGYGCESIGLLANKLYGFNTLSIPKGSLSTLKIKLAKNLGLKTLAWTALSEKEFCRIKGYGLDHILAEGLPPKIDCTKR